MHADGCTSAGGQRLLLQVRLAQACRCFTPDQLCDGWMCKAAVPATSSIVTICCVVVDFASPDVFAATTAATAATATIVARAVYTS